jgi:CRP/FNR family transcriptional regulator, cyclic AMP receptor protein
MPRGIPSQVIRHFQEIPLFSAVSKRGIRSIVQAATEVDVPPGKALVREGEFGRDMYVIVWGTATVTVRGKRLSELGPGDFFGELALLNGAARSATVTAASDMRVMVLGPREMDVIVDREPTIAKQLLSAMAKRIRGLEESHSH